MTGAMTQHADLNDVLHELQTHQAELEAQNRELRESREALEASRARYTDLFDFAPVG
jgi:outer membrane protein TolC